MLDEFCVDWHVEEKKGAQYGEVELGETVRSVLEGRGISKLYAHQAEAIKKVRNGKNIVLMAPTAAGKTECYMVPVVEAALRGETSLLLFPTKALSRDQWARMREFAMLGVRSAVYDGDTSQHERGKIRGDLPHVIITNVDMLHFILAHNGKWNDFFARLKYVVVDEIHAYSGVLGSHVANLMWRLKRICKNKPQFIVSSATISNALEFGKKICGEKEFELIEGRGAPKGKVLHAIINGGGSVVGASLKVAKEIGKKTIIFANSHNMAERLALAGAGAGMEISVYRSGLPQSQRRELEGAFHSGRIKYMAATSALELGMDVGDADLAVLAGFPGTITRFKQRVGRVGRKGQDAYAVFVAQSGALDQYYAQDPKLYLQGESEGCYANPKNEYVRSQHILAACRDKAVEEEEISEDDLQICKKLLDENMLRRFGGALIPTKEGHAKIRNMSMRNAGRRVKIYDEGKKRFLGERELSMAIGELYEGAVYLIGGKKYLSLGMDVGTCEARLRPYKDDGGEYTQAIKEKSAQIIEVEEEREWNGIELKLGKVHIGENVGAYMVKDAFSGEILSKKQLDSPLDYEFDTNAFWADWESYCDGTESFAEGLHALEHVSIAMMPAISGADGAEIGGISFPTGRIVYYEGVEGGSGLSEIVMPRYEECIKMSQRRLETCKCEKGCPSCILSPQCANSNYLLNKESALELCKKALGKKEK